ncbi:MAG: asparaginase [Alphaproteobacteria bacterium]|nr:asparaginase [Alphaproteobacteria bacterium]
MLHSTEPLRVESTRDTVIEKEYLVDAFACDSRSNVLVSLGNVERLVYPLSTIKLLQALGTVESGAADHFGLSGGELALSCASHIGEVSHIAATQSILAKIGLRPVHLGCGSEWPRHEACKRTMIRAQRTPSPLHHNCSGKHASGLCLLRYQGESISHYTDPNHPLQRQIVRNLERFTGDIFCDVHPGLDDCSYPTYPRPLTSWATAFARIANPSGFADKTQRAVQTLKSAVEKNPLMAAGENTFVSMFTRQFGARLYIKNGSNGFMAAAIHDADIGLALKVRSGQKRIASIAATALLEHLRILSSEEALRWRTQPRLNANGRQVGEVRVRVP